MAVAAVWGSAMKRSAWSIGAGVAMAVTIAVTSAQGAGAAVPMSAPPGTFAAAPGLGSLPYMSFDKIPLSLDKAVFTGSPSAWVAPAGFDATLISSGTSQYTLTYNKTGERLTFSGGRLVTDVDRNGVGNTYTYGITGSNKVTRITQASGRYIDLSWSSSPARIDSITDSAGRTWTYTRSNDQLVRVDGPAGQWAEYDYDASGRISEARFPGSGGADSRAVFEYDSQSRVTAIKQGAVGSSTFVDTTTFAYASSPKQTTVTDGNGHASEYAIDSSGRVTSATDALGRTRSQTWTASDDIATSTDAFASGSTPGNITTYSYDTLGNRTGTALPTGAAASATYTRGTSCAGTGGSDYQLKCATDAAGHGTSYDYDTNGNLTSVTDTTAGGTGAVPESYTYNNMDGASCGGLTGQVCTATDGDGHTTSYTYNSAGDLTTVTPPSPQGGTRYAYDSLGRVTSVTDGNEDTTGYTYNDRDQQTRTDWEKNSTSFTTSYFASGLRNTEADSLNGSKSYGWDVLGRMISETGPGYRSISYNYDPVGNLTGYDETGYAATYGDITYSYDAANELTQLTQWGGTCPTGTGSPADSGCVKFEYDVNGAETRRTLPGNATVTTTRDASGRPTRTLAADASGTPVADIGYSYTAASGDQSLLQSRTSTLEQGVPDGAVTNYSYDSLNRLTSATETVGSTTDASWAYGYDPAGNRTSQTRTGNTGQPAGTTTYSYDAANRITTTSADTTTWQYDAAGNQTQNGITGQTMSYNSRAAVNGIDTTTIAAFGAGNTNQLSQTNPAIVFASSSAFNGIASSYTPSSGATRAFTKTPGGDTIGVQYGAGSKYYFATDNLGSVIGLFDKTGAWQGGYSYSPYGETRATGTSAPVTTNTARYISSYYDTTNNLYKLGARYYDPNLGRFTQYDPTGQEANPYSYASCNPVNGKDPSGTLTVECALSGVELLLAGMDAAEDVSYIFESVELAPETSGLSLAIGATAAAMFAVNIALSVYASSQVARECF